MARIWSSGFELNSTGAGVEFDTVNAGFTIVTSTVRSGTYAGRVLHPTGAINIREQFNLNDQQGSFYIRVYINIAALPTAARRFLTFANSSSAFKIGIQLTSTGTLQLFNAQNSTQIGSDSSALSTGQWYCIELHVDSTTLASTTADARIDGVSFASGTTSITLGVARILLGSNAADTNLDLFFDDIALNDTTGSFQTSWPGSGKIVHLRPSAAGDNTQWLSSGASDFGAVNEVTPDDDTSYVIASDILIDDYNIDDTPVAISSSDTINVLQMGVRFKASSTTSPQPLVKLRFKSSSGGTVSESAAITFSSTGYNTNGTGTPFLYPFTLYQTPDSTTLTKANLDTAQIGLDCTNTPAPTARVTTEWLLVDFTPVIAAPVKPGYLALLGVGLS